jgi:hypothetical protein
MLAPVGRADRRPAASRHSGRNGPQENDPGAASGHAVLGPVLTGYDMWLEEEAQLQAQHEGRVHWLFLMRDGFMPMVHLAAP